MLQYSGLRFFAACFRNSPGMCRQPGSAWTHEGLGFLFSDLFFKLFWFRVESSGLGGHSKDNAKIVGLNPEDQQKMLLRVLATSNLFFSMELGKGIIPGPDPLGFSFGNMSSLGLRV